MQENLSMGVCEQSDQRLCYSLFGKYPYVDLGEPAGLNLTLSETLKTGFVVLRYI